MASTTWTTAGLSQEDFMLKDECILCDENDAVIGHANKKDAHIFSTNQVMMICILFIYHYNSVLFILSLEGNCIERFRCFYLMKMESYYFSNEPPRK